jgi:hypothetical protein
MSHTHTQQMRTADCIAHCLRSFISFLHLALQTNTYLVVPLLRKFSTLSSQTRGYIVLRESEMSCCCCSRGGGGGGSPYRWSMTTTMSMSRRSCLLMATVTMLLTSLCVLDCASAQIPAGWNRRAHMAHLTQYHSSGSLNTSTPMPNGCSVLFVHFLARNGVRYVMSVMP